MEQSRELKLRSLIVILTAVSVVFQILGNIGDFISEGFIMSRLGVRSGNWTTLTEHIAWIACMVFFLVYLLVLYKRDRARAALGGIFSVFSFGYLSVAVLILLAASRRNLAQLLSVPVIVIFAAGYIMAAISAFRGIPRKAVYIVGVSFSLLLRLLMTSPFSGIKTIVAGLGDNNIWRVISGLIGMFRDFAPVIFLVALLVFGLTNEVPQVIKARKK